MKQSSSGIKVTRNVFSHVMKCVGCEDYSVCYQIIIIIIITLFMSQMYLAEHRGSTNWGDRKSNQHKSNKSNVGFW